MTTFMEMCPPGVADLIGCNAERGGALARSRVSDTHTALASLFAHCISITVSFQALFAV